MVRPQGTARAGGSLGAGEPLAEASKALRRLVASDPDPVRKHRGLWSLYVIGAADEPFLRALLDHNDESIRTWAIRLLTDDMPIDTIFSRRGGPDREPSIDLLARFSSMARSDSSGLVRLALASTLQRLPVNRRVGPGSISPESGGGRSRP